MKRYLPAFLISAVILMASVAFAQVASPTPSPSPTAVAAAAGDLPVDQFLSQVFDAVKGFGGMNWLLKVSTVIMLLGATMKVSFLRGLIWDRLGEFKAIAGPALGFLAGLLAYFGSGTAFSLPGLFAYVFAGAGAIALHELLDAVKAIPGIGAVYVGIIDFVSKYLGGGSQSQPPSA